MFTDKLENELKKANISIEFTKKIIEKANNEQGSSTSCLGKIIEPASLSTPNIIDIRKSPTLTISKREWKDFIKNENFDFPQPDISNNAINLSPDDLTNIGYKLINKTAYGILNGGTATSYVDKKKNEEFSPSLFNYFRELFEEKAEGFAGLPKALLPAYYNADLSEGPGYLMLKILNRLKLQKKANAKANIEKSLKPGSIFQMVSPSGSKQIEQEITRIFSDQEVKKLASELSFKGEDLFTFSQISGAAITKAAHSFECFISNEGYPVALPGGHGQFFYYAKKQLIKLKELGFDWFTIGNIDNVGYEIDPIQLAITAILKKEASFEYIVRSKSDKKGGILTQDNKNNITCGELGIDVTYDKMLADEEKGNAILFNCAIATFNLSSLLEKIDWIIEGLPLKISYQEKGFGNYWHAEQNLWHVTGMIQEKLIFAVNKKSRFLASKFILENFLYSGLITRETEDTDLIQFKQLGDQLNKGLQKIIT